MKRLKKGFTLAEVLITLGIIGVVAAIVMPSVMTNYTYKVLGVKLAKFASQLEGSTRPFVVQNESFFANGSNLDEDILNEYIDESFLIKEVVDTAGTVVNIDLSSTTNSSYLTSDYDSTSVGQPITSSTIISIKDGTSFAVFNSDLSSYVVDNSTTPFGSPRIDTHKVGSPAFIIRFSPNVRGLPITAHQTFDFMVTDLGYVFPAETDECLIDIFDEDYNTASRMFRDGTSCHRSQGNTPDGTPAGD